MLTSSTYSLWSRLAAHRIERAHLHSSGHAPTADRPRLVKALGGRVAPIHTAAPDRYAGFFDAFQPHADGEWWPV
jgi:hypothetical protein